MIGTVPFSKGFTNSSDLVSLLLSRGLTIEDIQKSIDYIDNGSVIVVD